MNAFRSYAFAVACGLAGAAAPLSAAFAEDAAGRDGAVSLREVDIRAFIEDVANATGRTFIVDPRVSGKVTVLATQSLSERELFDVFQSTLRVNGFVAVPTPTGAYRIVPDEVAARDPGAPVRLGQAGASDRYVTQVISLRFADAESVANAIRPMLSPRGQISSTRRGNSIIVIDYGSTVARVRDAVTELDHDTSTYRTIRLKNTSAAEMARVAQGLVGQADSSLIQIVPVASSNTLVLRGDEKTLARYTPLVEQLDVGADFRSNVKVIPLHYGVAEEIVPVLQQISASMSAAQGADAAAAPARKANIAAHKATNSLIISADPETQDALAEVVRSLDVRRQQVLVEAIIVEVSDSAARDLGVQFLLGGDGSNAVPFVSTNYGAGAPSLLSLAGALAIKGKGADNTALSQLRQEAVSSLLASRGALAGVGGTTNGGRNVLGLILNALKEDTQSNVLSTPSVMTLDNETASLLVGQEIPVTTGETLSANNSNPFRTVKREDVGVQLEVTPHVSEGGAIRLEIKQEVSSIFGAVSQKSDDLITNKRTIDNVVQVDAGQVIALGGLIQDDIQKSSSGIPLLKDIPVVGHLFSSDSKTHRRTNLMVFLRPTLVTTPEQARDVTARQLHAVDDYEGIAPPIAARMKELGAPIGVAPNGDAGSPPEAQ